jgi:AraC-like DNA-binding protein
VVARRRLLSYLARAQRTVGDGLGAFERFAGQVWGNATAVRLEDRGAQVLVRFDLGPAVPRHAVDYLVTRTAISLAQSGARAREAWFHHGPGGSSSEYERVLRCPVRFRRPATGILVRTEDLQRPLRAANPEAAEALSAALAHLPARRAPSASARLAAAVEDALARGARVDREALARSLGMSGKTLARRLATERGLFRDVVDEVRRTLARRLVQEETLALGDVAPRVGFADLAGFGKAFRRWFGVSPSAVRSRRTSGRRLAGLHRRR